MSRFKIRKLYIGENLEFPKFQDIEFQFSKVENSINYPYTTLIIGANTTGKSRLLRTVLDIFNDLVNLKAGEKVNFSFKGNYKLEYEFGTHRIKIENKRSDLSITVD